MGKWRKDNIEINYDKYGIPEEWKPIAKFDGYKVSNLGGVRNMYDEPMRIFMENGYLVVNVKRGKQKVKNIVAEAFVSNDNNYKYVNNIDGDKTNCAASNLEWSNLNLERYSTGLPTIKKAVHDYIINKESSYDVGDRYGVTAFTIRRWVSASVYDMRPQGTEAHSADQINLAIEEYLNGESVKGIAKKYGVSRRTITQWVENKGIERFGVGKKSGITQEIVLKARNLYINEKLNCVEIGKLLNLNNRTVLGWVEDVKKTRSEIAAIQTSKGITRHHFGRKSIVETRFGKIKADSSYEADRLRQFDKDESIVLVSRCNFTIQYTDKNRYNPDFYIQYADGTIVIEEVKPIDLLNFRNNPLKHKAGEEYCNNNGYTYRIATELEIYGKRKTK